MFRYIRTSNEFNDIYIIFPIIIYHKTISKRFSQRLIPVLYVLGKKFGVVVLYCGDSKLIQIREVMVLVLGRPLFLMMEFSLDCLLAKYIVLQRTIQRVEDGSSLVCDYVLFGTNNVLVASVADPGCLSRIPDPGS
jgi:hypothetical protein